MFILQAQDLFDGVLKENNAILSSLNFELNGYIRGGFYLGPVPIKSGYESKDRYGEMGLKLHVKKLICFLVPTDIKSTGFLTFDYRKKDDDKWLYMPVLRKTRRIVSSENAKSFLG